MNSLNLNEKVFSYIRIDYSKPPPHPLLSCNPVKMTEFEAHSRNQSFSLNGLTERYIKCEG